MKFEDLFDIPAPQVTVAPQELSAYVPCYNEALRLPYFLEHHRRLGVTKFFVVDNGSTDGSTDILRAAPDVIWLPSRLSYGQYRQHWRTLICETYLIDRWVLAVDVDELFVYPGWPKINGPDLIARLDADGDQCLFTTMVDMHGAAPIGQTHYEAGQPFLDSSPYFDSTGYRYTPGSRKKARLNPTPIGAIHGGARERLFEAKAQHRHGWRSWLTMLLFNINRNWDAEPRTAWVGRILYALVKRQYPKVKPRMSKLPLVKWQHGYEYKGGVHVMQQRLQMSSMWGALLHFKYFQDFGAKVEQAVARAQHWNGAAEYQHYQTLLAQILSESPLYEGSKRFEGAQSLLAVGLMRD